MDPPGLFPPEMRARLARSLPGYTPAETVPQTPTTPHKGGVAARLAANFSFTNSLPATPRSQAPTGEAAPTGEGVGGVDNGEALGLAGS
eukprot:745627-Prorocentrum_minimum.AAC.4